MAPIAAEKVVPAVVVVIAHADAGAPAGAAQAGLFRHVGEGAVAVVLEKVLGGSLAVGIGFFIGQADAVGQVDVQPAVLVVIEKGNAAALGFNDVLLRLDASPDVGDIDAGLFGDVHESDAGGRVGMRQGSRLEQRGPAPSAQGSGEGVHNSRPQKN